MVRFSGVSNVSHNSAAVGGAIFTYINVVLTFNGMNNFINNSANNYGGGAIYATNSTVTFRGTSVFMGNSASNESGGAIVVVNCASLSFIDTSTFSNNFIKVVLRPQQKNVQLKFTGTNHFLNNFASNGSSPLYLFLPVKSNDAFSVFTAWINLDFGVETCFYN